MIRILFVVTFVLGTASLFFAQTGGGTHQSTPEENARYEAQQRAEDRRIARNIRHGEGTSNEHIVIKPRIGTRFRRTRSIKSKNNLLKNDRARFRMVTAAPFDVKVTYRTFLKQKNTEIFRLLPNNGCESLNFVNVKAGCENFVPGTWLYSFRVRSHTIKPSRYDIGFENGELISQGFLGQGIIVELGDIPIEDASLLTSGMSYLSSFVPGDSFEAASKQRLQLTNGIKRNGYHYSNHLKESFEKAWILQLFFRFAEF